MRPLLSLAFLAVFVGSAQAQPEMFDDPLTRLAEGRGVWEDVDAWADRGHGHALIKSLGHRLAGEFQAGAAEASPPTKDLMEKAVRQIHSASLAALMASWPVIGPRHAFWDGDALPALLAKVEQGDPAALSLACRLTLLPGETMGIPAKACRQGAALGQPESQYALAVMHHARPDDFVGGFEAEAATGLKVAKSRPDAIRLYRRAAESGHAGAKSRLAQLLVAGIGVKQDPGAARLLAEQSAAWGWTEGKLVLGLMMMRGVGGGADADQGRTLILQAAQGGNVAAQLTLAHLSMVQGADFQQALTWRRLSELSHRGDPPADEMAALLFEPLERTRQRVAAIGNAALDLDARLAALRLRKELAESGQWPLVDPLP
ncbi:MAG: sel1 repeat family protein [Magnetospirillum sp.]|nr:sel1 repeat family protein [Magnetospirillum sp.]